MPTQAPNLDNNTAWHDLGLPLLHKFEFHRKIVDEYHYLSRKEHSTVCSLIKKIAARRTGVLSGTPPLNNFSDVKEMASFLGVNLGRDHCGDGMATTEYEKRLAAAQTRIGKFLAKLDAPSYEWHRARHGSAQNFLDRK